MSENKMSQSLAKKMYDVMCETEAISKDMTVGSGSNSYRAVSEAMVLNVIKPLLKKHRMIIFPYEGSITNKTEKYETKYGDKFHSLDQVSVYWKCVDVDTGDYVILFSVGDGADSQDKGSGKAFTYAYKTMLQKTYVLFSGEDTDNTHSDDLGKEQMKIKEAVDRNWIDLLKRAETAYTEKGKEFISTIIDMGYDAKTIYAVTDEDEKQEIAEKLRNTLNGKG